MTIRIIKCCRNMKRTQTVCFPLILSELCFISLFFTSPAKEKLGILWISRRRVMTSSRLIYLLIYWPCKMPNVGRKQKSCSYFKSRYCFERNKLLKLFSLCGLKLAGGGALKIYKDLVTRNFSYHFLFAVRRRACLPTLQLMPNACGVEKREE